MIDSSEKFSAEKLFWLTQQERKVGEILPLPKTFYSETTEYVKKLESAGNKTEKENYEKMLYNLKEKRFQKILIYLAYGKSIPSQVPDEERFLYEKVKQLIDEAKNSGPKTVRIKINADLPELTTTTGNKIGPFKQNQIIEVINSSDAEFILNNKLGESI
ncbi:MAG: hypothetical protein ACP5MK_00640 [Candidatus Micrarchaeia archaeon]